MNKKELLNYIKVSLKLGDLHKKNAKSEYDKGLVDGAMFTLNDIKNLMEAGIKEENNEK